jgi:hypothetical protein
MTDRHYGHLARDGREHAIKLLGALNVPESGAWTLVDARWKPKKRALDGRRRKERSQPRQQQPRDSRLNSEAL